MMPCYDWCTVVSLVVPLYFKKLRAASVVCRLPDRAV